MKRITAVLLAIAMLCTLLAGCGATAAAPVETTAEPTTEPVKTFTLHAYVPESWGNASLWAWSDTEGDLFKEWPGENMTPAEEGWFAYEVPEWINHVIISGLGGSLKTEDLTIEAREVWIAVKEDGAARIEYEAFEIPQDGYYETLEGYFTSFNDGRGGTFRGLVLNEPMKDCYQLTVNLEITMKNGARCKEWQLLGLSGETSLTDEVLAELYLPDGTGELTQTIHFSTPVSFDALLIVPKVLGSYSWSQTMSFTDVWTLPLE